MALAAEVVVKRELVTTKGRNAGAEQSCRVGGGVEIADQIDDRIRQTSTLSKSAAELEIGCRFIVRVVAGGQEEGDFLEAPASGEALDASTAIRQ
jgi:hypothetical protein